MSILQVTAINQKMRLKQTTFLTNYTYLVAVVHQIHGTLVLFIQYVCAPLSS